MSLLQPEEIRRRLTTMEGWDLAGDALEKEFRFEDYMSGIRFVNSLAELAEAEDHHPDLEVGYSRVVVRFTTHSEGGVTGKDFNLARGTDAI